MKTIGLTCDNGNGTEPVQSFVPDPLKCLGTKAANTVLKVGAGGDIDITGWFMVTLYPVADGQIEFNGIATSIQPVYGGIPNAIIIHDNVTTIKISGECIVCGM